MQGDLAMVESSSGEAPWTAGGNSGEEEKRVAGNRWPRQETLALLKIRSEMDSVFRESTLKSPLWEEVSRKMSELGYNRTAKKCKEKFENVYKYHKRIKEGRTGKSEGKNYRFSDQIQALENLHSFGSKPEITSTVTTTTTKTSTGFFFQNTTYNHNASTQVSTVPLVTNPSYSNYRTQHYNIDLTNPKIITTPPPPQPPSRPPLTSQYSTNPNPFKHPSSNLFSSSTSSSTASEEELKEKRVRKKRKWKKFFKRLTEEVIERQEELQRRFLETISRREQERIAREEAWRIQETTRIGREHEMLEQERSKAAAKDEALITMLQKISGTKQEEQDPRPEKPWIVNPIQAKSPNDLRASPESATNKMMSFQRNMAAAPSSSRWPRTEVEALIGLRTNLNMKYSENSHKGPLWEEIAAGMRRLGYDRSAKRCKEKWENINKYFKKVKESNRKRPEDSKTCPYFNQLEALHRDKCKNVIDSGSNSPLMAVPEQQWPPMGVNLNRNVVEGFQENGHSEGRDDSDDHHYNEDHDQVGGFEMAPNKPASVDAEDHT